MQKEKISNQSNWNISLFSATRKRGRPNHDNRMSKARPWPKVAWPDCLGGVSLGGVRLGGVWLHRRCTNYERDRDQSSQKIILTDKKIQLVSQPKNFQNCVQYHVAEKIFLQRDPLWMVEYLWQTDKGFVVKRKSWMILRYKSCNELSQLLRK